MALAACSSDDDDGGACADISGNWSVKSTRVGGSCTNLTDDGRDETVSFSKSSDGTWSILIPGLTGSCPGTLDASCKFIANCEGGPQGGPITVTASIEYTFSGRTFNGTSVGGLRPPAVSQTCDARYAETGTKL